MTMTSSKVQHQKSVLSDTIDKLVSLEETIEELKRYATSKNACKTSEEQMEWSEDDYDLEITRLKNIIEALESHIEFLDSLDS